MSAKNRIVIKDGPIELEIGSELLDAVDSLLTTAQKIVVREFQEAAQKVLDNAKRDWPVRSKRSLRAFRVTTRLSRTTADVVIENPVSYAYKVKFSAYTKEEVDAIANPKARAWFKRSHGHGAPSGALTSRGAFAAVVRSPLRKSEAAAVLAIRKALDRGK
tara:strand:- start:3 stop:485 length:483 start_codon:yes stop_codon:yes gene_type:complete